MSVYIGDRLKKYLAEREAEAYPGIAHDFETMRLLLKEALDAMLNLAPRVKDYGGCFGRMAGSGGGKDCICTACKIRRALGE